MHIPQHPRFSSLRVTFFIQAGIASLLVAVLASLIILSNGYLQARLQIDEEFGRIARSIDSGLAASAWTTNEALLKAQAEAIVGRKHMSHVEIRLKGMGQIRVGTIPTNIATTRTFPLLHVHAGQQYDLGTVMVTASSDDMLTEFRYVFIFIIITQLAGAVAICLMVASLFRHKVAERLSCIVTYASEVNLSNLHIPLKLPRSSNRPDEFDVLADGINAMRKKIQAQMSDRVKSEQMLRTSEESFRSLFENIPDIVARYDRELRFISVNPAVENYSSLLHKEMLGKSHAELGFSADMCTKWDKPIGEVFLTGRAVDGDIPGFDPGHIFHWRLVPEFDDDGTVCTVLAIARDITERKRHEDELEILRRKSEIASQCKSEFLANMSHEIRTPLNGIMGMMQVLESTALDDEQKQFVLMAIKSTNRLSKLLSDILDLSKIEADKLTIHEEEFAVQELTDSVAELFTVAARDKGLPLICTIDPKTPSRLVGDDTRVRQILFNLVGNAIKFTDQGTVRLDVSLVTTNAEGNLGVLFSVSDTGIGIPDDKLGDLFKPFTQVDNSYTRNFQGAGLGLAIVKRLIDLMGGVISVTSSVDVGTSMNVLLPFKQPKNGCLTNEQSPMPLVQPKQGLRILMAEDKPSNSFPMKKLLDKAGHSVTLAENGQQVLDLLASKEFDVILMDVQMPVMDGVKATREIRQSLTLGKKKEIFIIAMTAYAMTGDREKFIEAGMNGYISKPVNFKELKNILSRLEHSLKCTNML